MAEVVSTATQPAFTDRVANSISSFRSKVNQNNPLPAWKEPPSTRQFVEKLTDSWSIKPADNGNDIFDGNLVFSAMESYNMTASCDISEHVLEDTSVVAQHISNKPIEIELSGVTANTFIKKSNAAGLLANTSNNLNIVSSYVPNFPKGLNQQIVEKGTMALNALGAVDRAIQQGASIYNVLSKQDIDPAPTPVQKAVNKLLAGRDTKQLYQVYTPFRFFGDTKNGKYYFVIKDLTFSTVSKENLVDIVDIRVVLRQLSFATIERQAISPNAAAALKNSYAKKITLGKTQGVKMETNVKQSTLFKATSGVKDIIAGQSNNAAKTANQTKTFLQQRSIAVGLSSNGNFLNSVPK